MYNKNLQIQRYNVPTVYDFIKLNVSFRKQVYSLRFMVY